jgi:hypothetical protein
MAVSAKSAQRAQFTFSTQGNVAHSRARGGEAGAQPFFFMSARLKPLGTPNLSHVRLRATQGSAYAYKDALKKHKPNQVKCDLARTHTRAGGRHGSLRWDDPGLEA